MRDLGADREKAGDNYRKGLLLFVLRFAGEGRVGG